MNQNRRDRLLSLRRSDKHYLGAGEGLIFAPPQPLWLDRPGFWDGVQLFIHRLRPAFTLGLLDIDDREIELSLSSREWTPAGITSTWTALGLHLTEVRCVVAGGTVVSDCLIENRRTIRATVTLAAWCCTPADRLDRSRVAAGTNGVAFRTRPVHAQFREDDDVEFDVRLRTHPPAREYTVAESRAPRGEILPDWAFTPCQRPAASGSAVRMADTPPEGMTWLYAALRVPLDIDPGESRNVSVAMDVTLVDGPHDEEGAARRAPHPAVPTHQHDHGTIVHSVAVTPPHDREGTPPVHAGFDIRDRAGDASRADWSAFLDDAPALSCDDPWIERFFDYRWYGLRLNFIGPAGDYAHPTCAEGTDFFHDAVSYSAWCIARELRWLRDPERARGTILTFLERQRDDGWIPGILYARGQHPTASYFADWGGSVLAIHDVWPDVAFLETAYGPLARYATHLRETRDAEGANLFRVLDPYETGQEMMSRYTAVDADADRQHFDYALDLLGVDITVYTCRLHRSLARIAERLGRNDECRSHAATADAIARAVHERMWDADAGLFFDIDPRSGKRTGIRAAVCFYPWMTDIAGPGHAAGFERNLFDPASFWTPYPVPSTARSDPTFDADGFWNGVRQNCPWNGRVWPMTNSHIAEALARQATTHSPHLRERAGNFILRIVRMMFLDGDPARPNSFEHYSPIDGRPCSYRGLDDYQHSWINDLIVRWVAGFRPTPDGFIVDPLPTGIAALSLERLPFRGRTVSIGIEGDAIHVDVDGARHHGRHGTPIEVTLA